MFEGLNWLWTIVVGGVAGWLADLVVPGDKVGILGAIIAGIIGGFLGGWIFGLLGLSTTGLVGVLLAAVVGAIIVLIIYRAVAKK
ncbi:MAG TPA: GlsB/YeaQ/YmgE family stress response membrane protein [Chloroflexi bacterium]|nr:GlsB/YeaQ/YmgE family stress response membrane protein [Chloroflexota bacterium]